ncbi:MAG: hypothetical protein HGB10_11570, partial [Coriobacteriia bacterium]|nr:hypothetical protein [Coriobacteriia bacterium]
MDIKSSKLVKDALEAVRPTRWWIAMLVVLPVVIFLPLFTIGTAVSSLTASGSFLGQSSEVLIMGATLILLVLWVVFKEKRPFSSVGFRGTHQVPRVLIGLAGGI